MFKEIKSKKEARELMLSGMKKLAEAVGSTFGPNGNSVVLCGIGTQPHVTKDGVTVAKEIEFDNPFENAGAQLLKEAAVRTVNTVGDATTTSTILGYGFCAQLMQYLDKEPIVQIKAEIEQTKKDVVEFIKQCAIEVTDSDIKNIATISANNDPELGQLIANAFLKVGRDGIITVEESLNANTTIDVVSGMQFDRGYIAPHFVTDTTKDQCVLENPYILITEHKINRLRDIAGILNPVVNEGRSILIIAEDYDDTVVEALKLNKLNGTLNCCAIKAPSYGEYRKQILEDLAILTGGFNVSYDSALELVDATNVVLGSCKKVVITKDKTTITEGNGDKTLLENRIKDIKAEYERVKNDPVQQGGFVEKFLQERIAKLTGGICVIHVGGGTELEMRERKDRVDDAVCATQAAIEEGIVPGGGTVYVRARNVCNKNNLGGYIIYNVLSFPFEGIVVTAGKKPDDYIDLIEKNAGFDALRGCFVEDMIKIGIVDPVKAVRLAFENAVSILLLFLNTNTIIAPKMVSQIV